MVQDGINGVLGREGEPELPELDAEFEEEEEVDDGPREPFVSPLRFKVSVPARPAIPEADGVPGVPKRDATVYYVYGKTREEALARLPADLVAESTVEAAGDGLALPESELGGEIFDGRVAPGTPGPVK